MAFRSPARRPDEGGDSMAVSISQSAPCQHSLHIRLPAEAVHPVRNGVVLEFQREATIAGFRKGKAPRELVERHYPEKIREETLRRLTRQVFEQVQRERKLKPVGPFEVTKLDFDEAKGLELEAQVEVEPEFALGQYRNIHVHKPEIAVTPQDVEQALAQLQESMAELVPTEEGLPAAPADTSDPSAAPAFPEQREADRQAGKPPRKEKRLPNLDDELAKDLGFETLDQLRTHVEAKLREQKATQQQQALEQALCDELLNRHPFDVPPRLVAKQTDRLTRDFQARCVLAGFPEDQIKTEVAQYTAQLQTSAARQVKLAFLLERIAEREQLSVTQDELVDRMWKLAKRLGKEPAEVRRLFDAQGLWGSVVSSVLQDKTIAFLFSVAQIEPTG